MKQLTGLDASFLYMETPTTYGHVNGLAVYDRPSPDFDPYAAVYERFGSLVGHVEPLRRRVVEVPFGLDHPYWVDDPHFDLDFHVPGDVQLLRHAIQPGVGLKICRGKDQEEPTRIDEIPHVNWGLIGVRFLFSAATMVARQT